MNPSNEADISSQEPVITSLWVGTDTLTPFARLTIASYLTHGYIFQLFAYEPLRGVPKGCVLRDARDIVPLEVWEDERYGNCVPAVFSDYWRFAFLFKEGGVWTDLDAPILKRFEISTERPTFMQHPDFGGYSPGWMSIPKGHRLAEIFFTHLDDPASPMPWDTPTDLIHKIGLARLPLIERRQKAGWGGYERAMDWARKNDSDVNFLGDLMLPFSSEEFARLGNGEDLSDHLRNHLAVHLFGGHYYCDGITQNWAAGSLIDKLMVRYSDVMNNTIDAGFEPPPNQVMVSMANYHPRLIALVREMCAERGSIRILEYGVGESTKLIFSQMSPGSMLVSVEHNPAYLPALAAEKKTFVKLVRTTQQPFGASQDYVTAPIGHGSFDLVVIDGRNRADCLAVASLLLKDDGVCLVHDSERPNYLKRSDVFFGNRIDYRENIPCTTVLTKPKLRIGSREMKCPEVASIPDQKNKAAASERLRDIVVFSTYGNAGLPHLNTFLKVNPGVDVHVINGPSLTGSQKSDSWRNCDREIRRWWMEQGSKLNFSRVFFVEYDVLFDAKLDDIFPDRNAHFVGRNVQRLGHDGWQWFIEKDRLPDELKPYATGISPLAVLAISRECLAAIMSHPLAEDVFSRNVFCELRIATLAMASGYTPESNQSRLMNLRYYPVKPSESGGVWHAVKI